MKNDLEKILARDAAAYAKYRNKEIGWTQYTPVSNGCFNLLRLLRCAGEINDEDWLEVLKRFDEHRYLGRLN